MWGTDNHAEKYSVAWAERWSRIDGEIFQGLNLTAQQIDKIYEKNLLRFIKG
jgi:hypothetical protein